MQGQAAVVQSLQESKGACGRGTEGQACILISSQSLSIKLDLPILGIRIFMGTSSPCARQAHGKSCNGFA